MQDTSIISPTKERDSITPHRESLLFSPDFAENLKAQASTLSRQLVEHTETFRESLQQYVAVVTLLRKVQIFVGSLTISSFLYLVIDKLNKNSSLKSTDFAFWMELGLLIFMTIGLGTSLIYSRFLETKANDYRKKLEVQQQNVENLANQATELEDFLTKNNKEDNTAFREMDLAIQEAEETLRQTRKLLAP
jgi:hypothetical protein